MQFDWTTFGLEILNFLVLVWLLQRFFYKPIQGAIEARRRAVDETLHAAEQKRAEAQAMKTRYEDHLKQVSQDEQAARDALRDQLAAERERRLAALETELSQARERARALGDREARERETALTREAVAHAARFAAKLLTSLATPELEKQLIDLLLQELPHDGEQAPEDRLRQAWSDPKSAPVLATAYPLDEPARRRIRSVLAGFLGEPGNALEFRTEPDLVAGVQLRLGTVALSANLRDELRYFQDAFHAE